MPSRGEPVIPFSPLKLLKADVTQDEHGVSMVLEFIDNNGVRLTTPSMPYPDNFDPMRIEHAECLNFNFLTSYTSVISISLLCFWACYKLFE